MAVIVDATVTLESLVERLNREIDSRRWYGVREEVVASRSVTRLWWCNEDAAWHTGRPYKLQDGKIKLDANEIVVAGVAKDVLDDLCPHLNQLPLHAGSEEAMMRGEFSLAGIQVPFGIAATPLGELNRTQLRQLLERSSSK